MSIAARIAERSAAALRWVRIRAEAIARNNKDNVALAEEAIARIADVIIQERSVITFRAFQATRREVADVSVIDKGERDVTTPGYVYLDDVVLETINGDPTLTLFRDQYSMSMGYTLEQLEAMLYAWCLSECGEDMGLTGETHTFVMALIDELDWFDFACAMLENAKNPDGIVCHMHDYADVNQVALDALGTSDIDHAAAIYATARPFIRGE